ncbi:MAG TPA: BolA family protein [Allosphingosinicella sp.]|nr:BolA family protein [Allosphingosinicella sp.]
MSQALTGVMAAEITRRLEEALAPSHLEVINDSARHRGHSGDDGSGESHFSVEIVSERFAGMSRLERQRAVNAALGDLMRERIHALSIKARTPGE